MNDSENLHAGHRERMINKLLKNPSGFSDHELLEVLLYFSVPRKDTNQLAHRLLNTFGGWDGLLNATEDQLVTISGVGKRVAADILVTAQIAKRLSAHKKKKIYVRTPEAALPFIRPSLYGKFSETFVMLLLDENYAYKGKVVFCDDLLSNVYADIPEILTAITLNKPTFTVIAHNHTSGNLKPSEQDDVATMQISVLCEIHGVNLVEHIIVGNDGYYSYKLDGRIQYIKESARLNNIFEKMTKGKGE